MNNEVGCTGVSCKNGVFPGFSATKTGTINIIGAETILYTHDKTGARVMYVANEDKERAMLVTFETPALDNKGIPHVFEHICASGSQKYDSAKLFSSAGSQTCNTHMNASTYDAMTSYEYSTMFEEQLLLIADYYLDSVFHPLLYTDKLIFKRDAWHYELADVNAPLNVNGIVYNEMKGAFAIERAAVHNTLNTLYPGSAAANDSGGVPKEILTMTYEDCVNFHQTYYHPSNALIFLYGDLNIEPFLKLAGDYCDNFDKKTMKNIYADSGCSGPCAPVTTLFKFPMEANSEVEDNSVICYSFNLGKLSPLDYASFEILSTILDGDSSPVISKLREVLPGASASVDFYATSAGCCLSFSAMGVNERDKDTLKAAVNEAIAEIIEGGFDAEHLEAAIASEEFFVLSVPERSGLGIRVTSEMARLGSIGLGYNYWNEYLDAIENAKSKYATGYFEAMVEKYIASNQNNALVVTVPAPGLKEKLDEQLRTELNAAKAAMSDEEIAEIIETDKALVAMSEEIVPAELLNRLTAVTMETFSDEQIEIKTYDIEETSLNGVKAYVAKAATRSLNFTGVDYNSAAVTLEDLHYLNLYADLLGEVPTKNLSLTALQIKMARYLYKFSATASSREFYDYSYKPAFCVGWYSVNDSYAEAVALVREMLTNADFSDSETISGVIGRLKTSIRSTINNSPHDIMQVRAMASRFSRVAYDNHMRGVAYYQFLSEAQKFLKSDPKGFKAKLLAVRSKLGFKDGVTVMFTGNANGIESFQNSVGVLLEHLTDEPVLMADLNSMPRPDDSEGFVVEASVQFNVAFASYGEIGLKYSGKLLPIAKILSDAYLTPAVQYTIGAYGCWAAANRYGLVFVSYYDPSVVETFAAYDEMAGFAACHGLSQEDVNRYIIYSLAQRLVPEGELNGARNAIMRKYQCYPDDYKLNILREIKSVTVRDLTDFSGHLAFAMDKGVRSTAGGQAVILENARLYKSIVYPLSSTNGGSNYSNLHKRLV